MSMYEMPQLDISKLTDLDFDERKIADMVVASQGKNRGRLRAAKPKIEYDIKPGKGGTLYRFAEYYSGCAAYVWRMVAFQVSPVGQHKCLPIMADLDIPEWEEEDNKRKELRAKLDKLADKIISLVPPT